jgi:hypothetical protein
MQIETPEGQLTIDDDELRFVPADNGPEILVSLSPMPDSHFERGIYGNGALVIDGQVIVLKNEDASTVVEELRRPRVNANKARKPETRSDSDSASGK